MKHIKIFSAVLITLLGLSAVDAHAEGMAITEWSARGMSLANGMVARADDASAVAYNPAGITQIPGTSLMLGSALTLPGGKIRTGNTDTKAEATQWIIPHFYVTHQLNDRFWVGAGVFARYGLGNSFPDNWPGQIGLTDVALYTATVNPNIVWKVNDHLSLAAGVEISGVDMTLKQKYGAANRSKMHGQGAAFGVNLALHLQLNEEWSMGLTWRSRQVFNVHGDIEWDQQLGAVALDYHFMQNADVHGKLCMPDVFSLGVAWKPNPKLSIEGDIFYTVWSNYRHLNIYLEAPANKVMEQPKHWKDTWAFSGSVEYKALDWLALRFGYLYETSPINKGNADYLVPSNGRHYFTFGTGFFWDNWTLDLAYTYIKVQDLDYNQSAAHSGGKVLAGKSHGVHSHNMGISLGYRF